jgi:hypothetical protein
MVKKTGVLSSLPKPKKKKKSSGDPLRSQSISDLSMTN